MPTVPRVVRVRRKYWDGALRDANAAMVTYSPSWYYQKLRRTYNQCDGSIPMIAYIAKGLATYREKRETMYVALEEFE